ncbi:MAG: ribonuclease HIII [Desulfurobacteriaceae bacterium]
MRIPEDKIEEVAETIRKAGGIEEKPPPYAKYRFRLDKAIVTIYNSGSVTVGGKETKRVKELITETALKGNEGIIVGCDEAGKGEIFGPLVIACIYGNDKCLKKLLEIGVKDSKKLKKEKIKKLSEEIKESCNGVVRILTPSEYNKLYKKFRNLNKLMEEMYFEILKKISKKVKPEKVIVDKLSRGIEEKLKKTFPDVHFEVVTKGEENPFVAAAAIVAKGERLKWMEKASGFLGAEIPEGNVRNEYIKILTLIPEEERFKFIKEHFNISGEEK